MPTSLRKGVPTGTVSWSDGTPFDGVLWIGLKSLVNGSAVAWPTFSLGNRSSRRVIPIWSPIPIAEGAYGTNFGVWYNADITPHDSQYIAYYYDSNGVQIAGPSSAFSVSSATFSVPALTLTVPTMGSNPTPDS